MLTRRKLIKGLIGAVAGFYLSDLSDLFKNTPEVPHPAPVIADTTPPSAIVRTEGNRRLSEEIIDKPFKNSSNYLITPSYDHSGQAVHPSLIDFKTEYGMESWQGFRYWMAFTPYPNFNSSVENPSLLVSKDGFNWINPPSIQNPLEAKPQGALNTSYNSDPELIFDPEQNQLVLYWREYRQNVYEKIWVKKIGSNFKKSDKTLCFENPWKSSNGLVLSPTVWRKSAKEWYMWTTNGAFKVYCYSSNDGVVWSSGQLCNVAWDLWGGGYIPWHIAVKPNYAQQSLDFLIAAWPKHGRIQDCQLFYAAVPMSQPLEVSTPQLRLLLKSNAENQWDDGYIYRSSFVVEPGETRRIRIWYSACSKKKIWHIGYTEGDLDNLPQNSHKI